MQSVLILGGTNFIGRRLVESLILNGEYEPTLFNRGQTNSSLFPNCKRIKGDRENEEDLKRLFSEHWDFVVDCSCYFPNSLKLITSKINKNISKYIFISTCSVYDNDLHEGMLRNETAPLLICNDEEKKDTSLDTYGKRKAACEKVLIASELPYIIFRPSLVYGPYDSTDRLYYWIEALNSEEEFILPENGERLFSITYVDDLVEAILHSLKSPLNHKVYNCISHQSMSIAQIIKTGSALLNRKAKSISIDADFLKKEEVTEWFDLPLWLNTDKFTFSNAEIKKDLNFNPIDFKQSLQETIEYYRTKNFPLPQYGMDRERRNSLLKKYKPHG